MNTSSSFFCQIITNAGKTYISVSLYGPHKAAASPVGNKKERITHTHTHTQEKPKQWKNESKAMEKLAKYVLWN